MNRRWSAEEDAQLRDLVAAGLEYRRIGRRLDRSAEACRSRASFLGVKQDRENTLANRQRGRERFKANPKKVARRLARMMKYFTPDERKVRAEELRQRNRAGVTGLKGRHHRPEVCARISAAHKGRILSPETRQRISEGRKAYWERRREAKQKETNDTRAAMMADARHQETVGAWGEVQHNRTEAISWCGQCERRVSASQAASCASPFCKAKALAA